MTATVVIDEISDEAITLDDGRVFTYADMAAILSELGKPQCLREAFPGMREKDVQYDAKAFGQAAASFQVLGRVSMGGRRS